MSRWLASMERHPHSSGLLTAVLLTLAAAPFGQWYLAWIALVPWLVAIGTAPSLKSAFGRGWLAGVIYFALNEWWLWTATIPGTIGVVVCSGFYWGLAAGIMHYLRLLPNAGVANDVTSVDHSVTRSLAPVTRIVGVAVVWVATEWLRCNTVSEFPWLPLGCTQSPLAAVCQIADISGVWGVSFTVMLVNAFLVFLRQTRGDAKRLWLPGACVAIVLLFVIAYGSWRLITTPLQLGPQVMLVQSNHPHVRGGASTTTPEKSAEYFLTEIEAQLRHQHADLVILPENEFPPLNEEARAALVNSPVGPALDNTYQRLIAITHRHGTALLVGGAAVTGWTTSGKEHIGSEIRNSAYFFDPMSKTVSRYDKIQLVPFSERLPFAAGPAWLTNVALFLAANRAVQPLHPGTWADLQPFARKHAPSSDVSLETPFVTPICLENVDPVMCARVIRDPATGHKRAQFFANLSNDGWFHNQEKYQHWQLLTFRCIENRVPMARCSNTGISGFIDSCGRVVQSTAPDQSATIVGFVWVDDRESFYMAHPDIFPIACLILVTIAAAMQALSSAKTRPAKTH